MESTLHFGEFLTWLMSNYLDHVHGFHDFLLLGIFI